MLAPLIALLADRKIIDDEADTNTKRFRTRVESLPDFLRRVDRPELGALVFFKNRYLDRFRQFNSWRTERFREVRSWEERGEGTIVVADRPPAG